MKIPYETPEISILLLESDDIMQQSDEDETTGGFNGSYEGPGIQL